MQREQLLKMKQKCLFPDSCNDSAFTETHISWVVITDHYAFKVKRPVELSFLDFSTLEKRKFYCEQEVKLNKRLAPDMYIGVIPLTHSLILDNSAGNDEIIDYAVKMKRMDNNLEMHKMLEEDKVTREQLEKLAIKIAQFHNNTPVVKNAFNTSAMIEDYANLRKLVDDDADNLLVPDDYKKIVMGCVEKSKNFLNDSRSLLNERIINGFQRDCHGDLNATNIFLYDDPVIFDCIEFNEEFRYIDVLNEIAFLCVDLDFYGKKDLSSFFLKSYMKEFGIEEDKIPHALFGFYKSYRANVRAKVTILSLKEDLEDEKKREDVKNYIQLMQEYCNSY